MSLTTKKIKGSEQKARRYKKTLGTGVFYNLLDLIGLSKDVITGKYKLDVVEWGIISGTVLYFFIPFDLLPDPIFADDIWFILFTTSQLAGTLKIWRNWKSKMQTKQKEEKKEKKYYRYIDKIRSRVRRDNYDHI